MWQRNPGLGGGSTIYPGQELVLSYRQTPLGKLAAGGYAKPDIDPGLLRSTLPCISDPAPFTYGFTPQGELIALNDTALLSAAKSVGVRPWLHLSTLTAAGTFSNQLSHAVFTDLQAQNRLIAALVETVRRKGYQGVDVDFEFILPEDANRYPEFIANLRESLAPLGIPVIFITAKGDVKDRVKGLRLGAEDYLVKPFDVVELLARVEVVLRRFHKRGAQLSAGDVVVDMEARMVTKAGVPVVLTNKEYGLLVLFIQNKNIALFKESLYEKVWGEEYDGDSRTLELHVQRLRKKMGWENQLVAVYKVGYRLEIA